MANQGQFALLRSRRFGPFFLVQFAGAANDNLFKFAFTLLVTYQASRYTTLDTALAVNLIAGAFILPFLLFSATSGQIADKFDKARVIRATKLLEVATMLLGALAFYFESYAGLLAVTFLLGTQATLFGPVKYAYLPQVLRPDQIVGGNGLVEMGTFVAILAGTMAGGWVIGASEQGHLVAAAACVGLALLGWLAALAVPPAAASDARLAIDFNPWRVTLHTLQVARRERAVFLSILAISWLWFFGAVFLTQFPQFARDVLGGGPVVANLVLAVFTIGVAAGALGCERMSRRQVEIGLVPFGSLGMTAFTIDLYFASAALPLASGQSVAEFFGHAAHWRVLADLAGLALFTGFYSVPLYALIQTRSEPSHRARIIAANNILNALFLLLAAGCGALALGPLGWSIPTLFLATGLANLAVAIYIYTLVPEFLLRFIAWLLASTMYRLQTRGTEHIPVQGAAVLVCNHVSYADALLLMAVSPRPIRFVMDLGIFRIPVLSWLFRQVKAIPIASARTDPEMVERAFARVAEELRDGQLVCIFPEGRITDSGQIQPFRPGVARILAETPVPVVPIALRGLWGSMFSRAPGGLIDARVRRGLLPPVGIEVGAPIAATDASPARLQREVSALRGDWW